MNTLNKELYPEYLENKFILGSIITDLFFEFMENDIDTISENEILEYLGLHIKNVDFDNIVIYNLKELKQKLKGVDKWRVYDQVEKDLFWFDKNKQA